MQQRPGIMKKLPANGLIQPQFMPEIGQTLRADAMLAGAHLHRVTRHKPHGHKGHKHQRNKGRHGQRDAVENIFKHWIGSCETMPHSDKIIAPSLGRGFWGEGKVIAARQRSQRTQSINI